jgi:hypothetical protein
MDPRFSRFKLCGSRLFPDFQKVMQHFSLYFDEWNEIGPGSLSRAELERPYCQSGTGPILEDATRIGELDPDEPEKKIAGKSFSKRQVFLTGILAAVKELRLHESFSPRTRVIRRSAVENVIA